MEIRDFISAVHQISEEKGISAEKVFETIEQAIAAAYKKDYGEKGQIIKAKLDTQSGAVKFWQVKIVVDQDSLYSEEEIEDLKDKNKEEDEADGKKVKFNPEKHIMLDEAKKIDEKIKVGEELETFLESKEDYGRIAAQTAKQVIMQKLREAERENVLSEYKDKEGEILSGIVQRIEGRNIFLDIGKTLGVLPKEEQVAGEFYRPGQRLKVFVIQVEDTPKGPRVFLSRAYPKLISKLFELEVPEIADGQVEIKAIAREAGSRTKIAVTSNTEGIDPIGASVGQRGTRVQAIINELGGEKIDIIEWSDDPAKFISNSLSPAKVLEVELMPKNKVVCIVPEDQLSLAIGKDGQNVRLAAKLTGWKIDVRGQEQKETGDETQEEVGEKTEEKTETSEISEEKKVKKSVKTKKPAKPKKTKEKNTKEEQEN
ncbi:transcription termination factor NusA [Patescibacteria group bacterium]|nr:transcription termination factor NusA [Patescibacteria group bacterium]MBU1877224.1 transcription termination factor NusA [Patescibacteria group bacterium]